MGLQVFYITNKRTQNQSLFSSHRTCEYIFFCLCSFGLYAHARGLDKNIISFLSFVLQIFRRSFGVTLNNVMFVVKLNPINDRSIAF
jgi:hypothetical protein